MTETALSKPLATPKVNANGSKNPTLSFRVRGDLYDRLKDEAQSSGYSLSETIERRLLGSFDLEADLALQDEIKAEMRGTIAALEHRIALVEDIDRTMWPDESTRALGKAFSRALAAVQHATGKSWREEATAAPIVAAVTRRLMGENNRNGHSLFAELFGRERIDFLADGIAKAISADLQRGMPPLPPLAYQDDPSNWTDRAHMAVTFRDKPTGELLQLVTGPEYDAGNPEAVRALGPDYYAAVDHFRPIRDRVDAESFVVHALKDGSTSWDSLGKFGSKIHVPAGQVAPPPPIRAEPVEQSPTADPDDEPRLIGMEETSRLVAGMKPPRGMLPPSIDDKSEFDRAMGPERPDGDAPPEPDPKRNDYDVQRATQRTKPRRKAKAPV